MKWTFHTHLVCALAPEVFGFIKKICEKKFKKS